MEKRGGSPKSAAIVQCDAIKVTCEHVKAALFFLQRMIEDWEYDFFINRMERLEKLSLEEISEITLVLKDDLTLRQLFDEISRKQGVQASALAARLNVSKSTVAHRVGDLKGLEIVESQERRKGYWLTRKGVAYLRALKNSKATGEGEGGSMTLAEKRNLILESIRELQDDDGQTSMIDVMDALENRIDRLEVGKIIDDMCENEGILIRVGLDWVRGVR